ncbi:methyl-accepting chemotaxis protein [Vibrio viridaestus]|uniref:Methyl-accepting chemotaxis protein n=1 Tax=Vibrio viridaestus TaxID=2487322 RepID=A0A3N9TLE7_9VIBR|nr:methyl-accepting chemotaxis protein [Vibrio viridaestus]RQW65110.1 methyl-accepting chemotaxis protein [Vibrio viridaestus]
MRLTLKFKVVLSMVVAIIVTALTLVLVSYQSFEKDSWRAIYSETENSLDAHVSGISDWFHDKQLALEGVKDELEKSRDIDMVPHLRQLMKSGGFGLSYYGNEQGEMFRQDPSLNKAGYDPRVRGWYKLAMQEGKAVTTDPYVSATMQVLVVTLADPVKVDGKIVGVVGSNLALDKLTKDVLSIQVPGKGYAFLVNEKGSIVAHPNKDYVLKPLSEADPNLSLNDLISSSKNKTPVESYIDGKDKILVAKAIAHTDWMLVMVLDKATLQAPINAMLIKQLSLALVILAVMAFLGSIVVSKQLKGLTQITQALTDIADGDGDLTQRIDVSSKDEVGILAAKFNEFVGSLHTMISKVKDVTTSINSKADQSANAATQRSDRVRQQQDEITMVATAVTEMASATAEIANNAENTAKSANQSVALGNQGYEQMQKSMGSINQLASKLESSAQIIKDLESHTNEISTILSTITAIAEQTNLLALNAAIEAARAGEQGRGFAVVADEVRVLSQRTHQSTEEIHSKIEGLQKVTGSAVSTMTESHGLVNSSVSDFTETSARLQEMSQAISLISDMATQIAAAAEEQSLVTADINGNTESVRELSDGLANEAIQGVEQAHELRDLVSRLEKEISRFKL